MVTLVACPPRLAFSRPAVQSRREIKDEESVAACGRNANRMETRPKVGLRIEEVATSMSPVERLLAVAGLACVRPT